MTEQKRKQAAVDLLEKAKKSMHYQSTGFHYINKALALLKPCETCRGSKRHMNFTRDFGGAHFEEGPCPDCQSQESVELKELINMLTATTMNDISRLLMIAKRLEEIALKNMTDDWFSPEMNMIDCRKSKAILNDDECQRCVMRKACDYSYKNRTAKKETAQEPAEDSKKVEKPVSEFVKKHACKDVWSQPETLEEAKKLLHKLRMNNVALQRIGLTCIDEVKLLRDRLEAETQRAEARKILKI